MGKILILILLLDTWSSQKNFLENAGLAVEMAVGIAHMVKKMYQDKVKRSSTLHFMCETNFF